MGVKSGERGSHSPGPPYQIVSWPNLVVRHAWTFEVYYRNAHYVETTSVIHFREVTLHTSLVPSFIADNGNGCPIKFRHRKLVQ